MSWHGIEGHDAVVENLRLRLEHGRLASTFLFVGPSGIGKRTFALKFAQALLCSEREEALLDPCETCPACQLVIANTHPDILQVAKLPNKANVDVEQLLGPREKRMSMGFLHDLSLKPYYGRRRIGIIDDADTLGVGTGVVSANCLLKTLEEPPPRSVLILIGTSEQRQLSTIRSRSQVIRFEPLPVAAVARLALAAGIVTDAAQAGRIAQLSGGSLSIAAEFASAEMQEFRASWLRFLADPEPDSVAMAAMISKFIENTAKEAPPRRARLKLLAQVAADFYRQLSLALAGLDLTADEELCLAAATAAKKWNREPEVAVQSLERCLDVFEHVDANANLNLTIDAWLDDLAQLRLAGRLAVA